VQLLRLFEVAFFNALTVNDVRATVPIGNCGILLRMPRHLTEALEKGK
jgi:hypothetical protein